LNSELHISTVSLEPHPILLLLVCFLDGVSLTFAELA
jgi:hypothetical protein